MTDFSTLPSTIWGLLEYRADLSPNSVMLADEHGHAVTYSAALRDAEDVAAGLLDLGVRPGHVVSWQLPTRVETVILSLALARIGVVQNPVIPVYRRREVAAMLRQCASDWFVTVDAFRGFDHAAMARELARERSGLRLMILDAGLPTGDSGTLPPAPSPTSGDAVRWIYTTSGTTSAPKGVCHSDASLLAGGYGLAAAGGWSAEDVGAILFPYAHIGGPDQLTAALAVGMKVVLMEAFDPKAAMVLQREQGVTISGGATPFYLMFLEEQRKAGHDPLVPSLRVLMGGGGPMAEQIYHDVLQVMGIPVVHGYGMTECPMITINRPGDGADILSTTVGQPVPGCELQIRSDGGQPVPTGEPGNVWVRGQMLFHHYLVDGEVVVPHDEEGWFDTGDLGFVREAGHVVLVGRAKDLIIRKGESISPMEIEEVLRVYPGVQDVAVVGVPDPARGELVCAAFQLHTGAVAPTVSDLREFCREAGLSPFKAPERVEIVDAMPRTPTMKIRKEQLKQDLAARADTTRTASALAG